MTPVDYSWGQESRAKKNKEAAVLVRAMAILAALTIFAAEGQGPSEQRLDALMHKSGIWNQVVGLSAAIVGNVDKRRKESADKLTREQSERITIALGNAYSPEVLRSRIRASLAKRISAADVDAALRWLESDLGRKLTLLEEASTDASAGSSRGPAAQRLYSILSTDRRDRLERFARAKHSGERVAAMVEGMTLASAEAFAAARGQDIPSVLDPLKRKFESDRPALVKRIYESTMLSDSYIFRTVSDSELDQYIQFLESPAGKRYDEALANALIGTLVASSGEAGRAIIKATDAKRGT
jgi:hypothetical protein